MSFVIVLSILDSLMARTSISLLLITILNSSICLGRLAIFKLAILKPLILGISRSLELVLIKDTCLFSLPLSIWGTVFQRDYSYDRGNLKCLLEEGLVNYLRNLRNCGCRRESGRMPGNTRPSK